jgi:hypothetical protein
MAGKSKYYNVDDYTEQKKLQGTNFKIPPKQNFLAAAHHIRDLFESKKFMYGVMGGLEMLCLNHRRQMPDLHIAYDNKDYDRLKSKLEKNHRYVLSEAVNAS